MAAGERVKTTHVGVYSREGVRRRHAGKPDVCYEVTYRKGDKKIWERVGWKSEGYSAAMAAQVRAERIREMRHAGILGVAPPDRDATLSEAWLAYSTRHLAAGGRQAREDAGIWRRYVEGRFGAHRMSCIGVEALDAMTRDLEASGLSPQTVVSVLSFVRRVWNRALDYNLTISPCPARKARKPRVNNQRMRFLSRQEASDLLDALAERSRRTWLQALISLHMGLRFGEIASLTAARVDFDRNCIHLLDTKSRDRVVPMTAAAREALTEWIAERDLKGETLLFPARKSEPEEADRPAPAVSDAYGRAVDELGLNRGVTDARLKVCFHTLRHTHASWLAQAGVPIYQIAEQMGHATLEMSRRYMHLAPEARAAALAAIEGRREAEVTPRHG